MGVTLHQLLGENRFSHYFLTEPELYVPHTMASQGFPFLKEVCLCAQCGDGAAVLSVVGQVSRRSLSPNTCKLWRYRKMCCLFISQMGFFFWGQLEPEDRLRQNELSDSEICDR